MRTATHIIYASVILFCVVLMVLMSKSGNDKAEEKPAKDSVNWNIQLINTDKLFRETGIKIITGLRNDGTIAWESKNVNKFVCPFCDKWVEGRGTGHPECLHLSREQFRREGIRGGNQ